MKTAVRSGAARHVKTVRAVDGAYLYKSLHCTLGYIQECGPSAQISSLIHGRRCVDEKDYYRHFWNKISATIIATKTTTAAVAATTMKPETRARVVAHSRSFINWRVLRRDSRRVGLSELAS